MDKTLGRIRYVQYKSNKGYYVSENRKRNQMEQ